jgi:hypothetical protein
MIPNQNTVQPSPFATNVNVNTNRNNAFPQVSLIIIRIKEQYLILKLTSLIIRIKEQTIFDYKINKFNKNKRTIFDYKINKFNKNKRTIFDYKIN